MSYNNVHSVKHEKHGANVNIINRTFSYFIFKSNIAFKEFKLLFFHLGIELTQCEKIQNFDADRKGQL